MDTPKTVSQQTNNAPCPCGNSSFETCCKPVLADHRQAKTAAQLMRARYSAFCTQNLPFLLDTYRTAKTREQITNSFNKIFAERTWHHLKITETVAGEASDDTGIVQFYAVYSNNSEPENRQFTNERSSFEKDDGLWYFCKSDSSRPLAIAADEPCWCGSGKNRGECHPA